MQHHRYETLDCRELKRKVQLYKETQQELKAPNCGKTKETEAKNHTTPTKQPFKIQTNYDCKVSCWPYLRYLLRARKQMQLKAWRDSGKYLSSQLSREQEYGRNKPHLTGQCQPAMEKCILYHMQLFGIWKSLIKHSGVGAAGQFGSCSLLSTCLPRP